MYSAFACCTGGMGLIPAFGKSKKNRAKYSDVFSPFWHNVVGHKNGARPDNLLYLPSPLSKKNILVLAAPSMGEHSVSLRNGKKEVGSWCVSLREKSDRGSLLAMVEENNVILGT